MRYSTENTKVTRLGVMKGLKMLLPILTLIAFIFGFDSINAQPDQSGYEGSEAQAFEFPTSEDDANFHFTSVPDLFNWNIKYPQPGWEDAMDWFLDGMKKEGPAFMLNAGDIMDARWWSSKEQVIWETNNWWGGFKQRFEDKNIKLYIAPGDHEYGDDQGLRKMHLTPVFAEQFTRIFDMPKNGPEHMEELAYSFTKDNLAVISVNTFEDAGDRLSMTVSGKQLEWLEEQLKKHQDKEFVIVQGHVPVFGPVASKNSSANMLEGGADTEFWKTMVEYGVDAYLCGEHHRVTAKERDGIWQIVHGALWGTQTDVNYMRGSVYDGRLKFELFRFPVEYSGGYINEDHPHRGETNRPHQIVSIPETVRKDGPNSVGQLIIEAGENGNKTVKAIGEFKND
ncbi:MAG: metallophosphoesterase family protein [Bacteroidota bacterium]